MKALQVLDRIEYKHDHHHCFTEEEVLKAMKKYAKQKCKEQIKLCEAFIKSKQKGDIPLPDFD